ncbi:hypothetical protein EDB87DRAFT_1577604 [Lactarius vividus]|nr:hypothetical protein EDB87DRAFT_1577604 [Lactarius vividus]
MTSADGILDSGEGDKSAPTFANGVKAMELILPEVNVEFPPPWYSTRELRVPDGARVMRADDRIQDLCATGITKDFLHVCVRLPSATVLGKRKAENDFEPVKPPKLVETVLHEPSTPVVGTGL